MYAMTPMGRRNADHLIDDITYLGYSVHAYRKVETISSRYIDLGGRQPPALGHYIQLAQQQAKENANQSNAWTQMHTHPPMQYMYSRSMYKTMYVAL